MAFARLFPIDVANAQDGDRTFSERLGLSDDACCSLQLPRGACLHLLCSSSPLPPLPPAEKPTARQDQAGKASTSNGAQEQNSSAFNYHLEGNFGADSDYERLTCT